ncbi:MAG: universal stress protein [Clostridia bacterium]|nr:universal stress protein [Deltaproteobacteria bacterium]
MIIVAIALTDEDTHPLNAAAELARRLDEPLVLVHVHRAEQYAFADTQSLRSRASAITELESAATRLRSLHLKVRTEILDGEVVAALCDCASRLRPRLVVIGGCGTERESGTNHIARRLSLLLHCPFLVSGGERSLITSTPPSRRLRVVVALDDTRASDAAVLQLRDLRASMPLDCTIVSFYWPPQEQRRRNLPRLARGTSSPAVESAMKDDLTKRVGVLSGEGDVTFKVVPIVWHLGEHIADEARNQDADFVLIGTHQRTTMEGLLFGSVTQELLYDATISVLFAPIKSEVPRTAAAEPRRVLVATDLSDAGNRAIAYACVYLRNEGGVLELLHVLTKQSAANMQSATDQSLRPLGTSEELARSRLAGLVPEVAGVYGLTARVHIVSNDSVASTIADYAAKIQADAICLATQGRNAVAAMFVGSVSAEVIRMTSHPVLLVP